MRSKLFHLTISQLSITLSPPWKHFTRHGPLVLTVQSTPHLRQHSMQHARRLTTTMKKQQIPQRISWQWVRRVLYNLNLANHY